MTAERGSEGVESREGRETAQVLRALIVDDEPPARDRLRRLLERVGGSDVIAEAATGRAALEAAERLAPDVIFLDIHLPDLSGLRVLEALDDPPAVIFCTAHAEHAVEAFDLEAVDYLLKPYSADRLARALERARRFLDPSKVSHGRPDETQSSGASSPAPPITRIAALDGLATALVPVEAAVALRVEEGVTFLLRDDGERLICDQSIRDLEAALPPHRFFRANRQAVINLDAVLSFRPTEEGGIRVKLRAGVTETVSRRRARSFRDRLRVGPADD